LIWHADGSISFRANNGKLVGCKKSGHLFANCDNVEENAKYYFYLINRPGNFISLV
jgi:fascin 1/2